MAFARDHHPDLATVRAGLLTARADSLAARHRPFNPEFELQFARGGESFTSGQEGGLEVGISQELELWGKRGERRAIAVARLGVAGADIDAAVQRVEAGARAAFRRSLFLRQRRELLLELLGPERRIATSTQARVRDGAITPLSGRLTDLELLQAEAQLARAETDYGRSLVDLGAALGAEVADSLTLLGSAEAETLLVGEREVVEAAIERRRETESFRRRIAEREAVLRLARVEGKPNVTVGASLGWERSAFASADIFGDPAVVSRISGLKDTDRVWRARVSMPLPLWQRNQGGRALAEAEVGRARAERDAFLAHTRAEIVGAVRRFNAAARLNRAYADRSDQIRRDLDLVRDAYADGRIPLESYLTQKARLVATLVERLDAEDQYWEARNGLELAAGADLEGINSGGPK